MTSTGPGLEPSHRETTARRSPRSALVDLVALAVPPAAWFVHLNASYVLVPPSCRAGHRWFIAGATLAALAVMVPAALRSLRARRSDRDPEHIESFLGTFGLWFAALFALATFLVGLSAAVVGPCG